jgi:hypothetical protein
MSDSDKKIRVTLNKSNDPPVTFDKPDLELKHRKKYKVIWKQADGSADFTFESLTIDGETFTNPTDKKDPKSGGALSDVNVGDDKITLKDDVGSEKLEFPYTITVKAGGTVYSSKGSVIKDAGGSARIRNEAGN